MPAPPKDQVFDSERMLEFVRNYLKQCVANGNCVIVGRGAACALVGVPGVFNIFVYASMSRKVRWFETRFPEQATNARSELEATDSRREAYVRRYYDRDWADRRLYHMMINSCMGCDAMIDSVLDGAGMSALRESVAATETNRT
jgi:cytidylate kinase